MSPAHYPRSEAEFILRGQYRHHSLNSNAASTRRDIAAVQRPQTQKTEREINRKRKPKIPGRKQRKTGSRG
ncbi:hypothetical protein L6164_008334 [Bauhinia variegata]|uniref:Uncharacterized protein n=1 Tax=Bauhinia variegata TaxID=167791 RepID=A0ACB9PLX1_BAUVA|nr:hypothetical protein L6164_008334 [Bauhinia variegata]